MRHLSALWHRLFALSLLATVCVAQAQHPVGVEKPRITQEIDESHLVTLKGSVHPLATKSADQGAVADSTQLGRTILVLKSSDARQAALKKLTDDQQNPKSASFHNWLKPAEYGEQFGAAPQDMQQVIQWLVSKGFQVEAPMAGNNLIMFSGTQGQLKAAFHTEIHTYKFNGETYFANATDPQIPEALAPIVSGFSSLNSFPRTAQHTKPQIIRRDKSSWKTAGGASKLKSQFTTTDQGNVIHAIGPYDLATIYNIKPLWDAGIDGTGQTIAIVSDTDINTADVDYFRSTFGLPATNLNVIHYGPNPGQNGNEGEADLDVEWAGAVAKNATIDLVVAADSATSAGIDAAAAYIINNNLASILNVSYGACELALGIQGNQYYNQIWEQAAAQGITVLVASGDAGSASCDQNQMEAQSGLSVNGLASTPYNIAVGGTDLYSAYTDPDKYWSTTNDPTTLASAKSYMPETPWNDGCGSPEVLTALQTAGANDSTREALCNDGNASSLLTTAAGSGGASNCIDGDQSSAKSCTQGTPKPAWQSGIVGIPKDGVRDLPDISLMAGNGFWSAVYVYCESDVTPDGRCDVNNELESAGGTSFASPIFAGIMALVQQKTAQQQGNANYVLYKLASAQYQSGGTACSSANVASGNSCLFYDTTEGSISVPCVAGTANCTPDVATDVIGLLPGFDAGTGYDLATGLGSVNATNLVNGWGSASGSYLPTTTTLTATGSTTAVYGSVLNIGVAVAAANGNPSGDVGITTNSTVANNGSVVEGTLTNGQVTIGAQDMLSGTYQLFARYAGDAIFAPSLSTGLSVTVTPAAVGAAVVTTTRTTIAAGQYVSYTLSISGVPNGINPTGTVTFTDTTSGQVLGTVAALAGISTTATAISTASIAVSASELQTGSNSVSVSYSGDANYSSASAVAPAVTSIGLFTASVNPAALTVAVNTAGSVVVEATPNGNTVLDPTSLSFACPANVPAGLSCSFSKPIAGSGGSVTSILTLQAATPLYKSGVTAITKSHGLMGVGAFVSLAGLLMFGRLRIRRKNQLIALLTVLISTTVFNGCAGGGSAGSAITPLIATTTALSVSSTTPTLGSPTTLTAKVTGASGTGTPTGTITFSSAGVSIGSAQMTAGTGSLSVSSLPVGAQSLTAIYSGDTGYSASTSTASGVDVSSVSTITVTIADGSGNKSSAPFTLTVQ